MSKILTTAIGVLLVALGALGLIFNLGGQMFGLEVAAWQLWPLALLGISLALLAPPVLAGQRRGAAGALYIAGLPLLAIGGIGLLSQIAPWTAPWARFWPQIVLGLALGLLLAGVYLRTAWLILPGALLAGIGAALQFTALTGWWDAWAVLWIIAPLSVGLALVAIGATRHSAGVFNTGLIISAVTISAALGLMVILSGLWRLGGLFGGLVLILAGLTVLLPQMRAFWKAPFRTAPASAHHPEAMS